VSFSEEKARRQNVSMIYVKAKPGRRAYFEGRIIPEDKFVPVTDTPYIRRLVRHWEDLEVEGEKPRAHHHRKEPGHVD